MCDMDAVALFLFPTIVLLFRLFAVKSLTSFGCAVHKSRATPSFPRQFIYKIQNNILGSCFQHEGNTLALNHLHYKIFLPIPVKFQVIANLYLF